MPRVSDSELIDFIAKATYSNRIKTEQLFRNMTTETVNRWRVRCLHTEAENV